MMDYKTHEMIDIYKSWEPILQSKLSDVDHLVRQIFREMAACGVSKQKSEPFMQKKFLELIEKIAGGDSDEKPD